MSKIILDARPYGHHPMEMELSGHGTLLLKLAQACQEMGHNTNVILQGQAELFEGGISYWPQDRHPNIADVVIGISPAPNHDLRAKFMLGPSDIFGLGFCVEPYETPKVAGRVLYSAGANKGLWHMRHIWPMVTERVPGATLCITHDPMKFCNDMRWTHDYQGLEAIALSRWMEEDKTVQMHRSLSRSEFLALQGEAEIMAFPYDPILPTGPSYPTSVGEAAAAGCALLVADSGNAYRVYERAAGFMQSPLACDDWADVLVEWLTDAQKLREGQDKAQAWASQCTKEGFYQQLEVMLK